MLGYLRLVRLPNVFTALADVLAGYVISRQALGEYGEYRLAPIAGASACLYLSGMAFNDIADRKEDAEFRPNRPIPSGQVSLVGAIACGFLLMAAGVGLAFSNHMMSGLLALVLAVNILKYDFGSKQSVLMGPLFLGICRFVNVLLALTTHPDAPDRIRRGLQESSLLEYPWAPALAVGIYAAGLTAYSAQEESGKQNRALVVGSLLCNAGIVLAALSGTSHSKLAWAALAPLALLLQFLTFRLRKSGTPEAARDLVRAGVMGICVLDAGLILGFGGEKAWPYALGCVALLIPGLLLGKLLRQSEA
jgi:4-hydroxybenzoate polyprenyltransferase